MIRLGILRCAEIESDCAGNSCFAAARQGTGACAELGPCQVVGIVSCGGCPGRQARLRATMLLRQGAEVLAIGSCISRKGLPKHVPCPFAEAIATSVRTAVGDRVRILDWTH
jgi:predicted metal-binding protein